MAQKFSGGDPDYVLFESHPHSFFIGRSGIVDGFIEPHSNRDHLPVTRGLGGRCYLFAIFFGILSIFGTLC